jgi:hypothetical protein
MNRSRMLQLSLASLSALCAVAQAGLVTLTASERGSQSLSGQTSTWFTAGQIDVPYIKEDYRAFAVFDLEPVAGLDVRSAVISLNDFEFSKLPFPVVSFQYTLSRAESIRYADLEGGLEYGARTIDPFPGVRSFDFQLEADALADLQHAMASSATLIVGMSATGATPGSNWTTFLESFPAGSVSMVLATGDPVPEPATLGIVFGALFLRRHR